MRARARHGAITISTRRDLRRRHLRRHPLTLCGERTLRFRNGNCSGKQGSIAAAANAAAAMRELGGAAATVGVLIGDLARSGASSAVNVGAECMANCRDAGAFDVRALKNTALVGILRWRALACRALQRAGAAG